VYRVSSAIGLSLNSLILVVAFMIFELRNLINLINTGPVDQSSKKAVIAVAIIILQTTPVIVLLSLPSMSGSPT